MEENHSRDIRGFEYDWLACDGSGYPGFFSTAGGGYAPAAFLASIDDYDRAIAAILAVPATSRARFAPPVAAGLVNTWQLMAERGVFAYDSDPHGGPYRLVAAPEVAMRVEDLPRHAADVVTRVVFQDLRFAELTEIAGHRLAPR